MSTTVSPFQDLDSLEAHAFLDLVARQGLVPVAVARTKHQPRCTRRGARRGLSLRYQGGIEDPPYPRANPSAEGQ